MTTAIEIHRTDNCDIYKYQDGHLEYDYKPFRDLDVYRVACEQTNRKARLIEYDPKYCDVIVKRMIKLDSTLIIKRNGHIIDSKKFE